MTVHRTLRALERNGDPLDDFGALLVFTIAELRMIGFASSAATDLLAEFPAETRYLAGDCERRCWISLVDRDNASFRIASTNERHLTAVLDAMAVALVVPLHPLMKRAQERLAALKAKLSGINDKAHTANQSTTGGSSAAGS